MVFPGYGVKSILDRVATTESSSKRQPESWLVFLYHYWWGNLSFPSSVSHWLTFVISEREGGECWFSFGIFCTGIKFLIKSRHLAVITIIVTVLLPYAQKSFLPSDQEVDGLLTLLSLVHITIYHIFV